MADDQDDHLAYGDFHADRDDASGQERDQGSLFGNAIRRLQRQWQQQTELSDSHDQDLYAYGEYPDLNPPQSPQHHTVQENRGVTEQYQPQLNDQNPPSRASPAQGSSTMSSLFNKVREKAHETVYTLASDLNEKLNKDKTTHSHTHSGGQCSDGAHDHTHHRFGSFAFPRGGNDIKWFVDGCGYFAAVAKALETASESIWILDWWLTPELYLRRPPAKNEQYRVDRMLLAAAERGVKVNIIVYKEVTQALTRKYLSPLLPDYLHSLVPWSDSMTSLLCRMGIDAAFASLEEIEAQNILMEPVTVSSAHTKHALEDLHRNICVFRHPDHLPDAKTLQASFISSIKNLSLNAKTASELPDNTLKAIYGTNEDVVLYWAHHEKLLLIDGHIAFMGGLDLCFGRWDMNQHPIADAHPENLEEIIFPGQDFNNARIMDFQDVVNYQDNKLDRKTNARMGWSDVSLSLKGPVVQDLQAHFVERWNFIYDDKYAVRKDDRYSRLSFVETDENETQQSAGGNPPGSQQQNPADGSVQTHETVDDGSGSGSHVPRHGDGTLRGMVRDRVAEGLRYVQDQYEGSHRSTSRDGIECQIVRSCAKWSHGIPTEHSIANAYIEVIKNSQHFIYIENQFFITATCDAQKPIKNRIGGAIVDRILTAARAGEKYKVIVVIPAVPAFAGDLRNDDSLATRAIMEFQYFSINRGGHSIMESIAKEGFNPADYIRFYNLRNYDRINSGATMQEAENQSGVDYEEARKQHDNHYGAGFGGQGEDAEGEKQYQKYQEAAGHVLDQNPDAGRWDTVSECYMLDGKDVSKIPWTNGEFAEIDAFVSEELYVHSKLLIADDRIVICGSANLNDRSQLGDHDSEIAIIVQDPTPLESRINGQAWRASHFAATLRRQICRKHLGLLRPQDLNHPDENWEPIGVPNRYDLHSAEDAAVVDPLSDGFLNLWNGTAKTNTDAFARVFHPVPYDGVTTWKEYDEYYGRFFREEEKKDEKKEKEGGDEKKEETKATSSYKWGHVVAEEFSAGPKGVQEVKEVLGTVRGTLVEMPLQFLIKEDIAREGLGLNAFTEEVYT
ncbi:MAG: hypothetical protein M1819_006979 [Sarea resinae]|nr:MAG: hypothetical protein M1819_006979 [Sarea resinae]